MLTTIFGKHKAIYGQGLNVRIPFFEKPKKVYEWGGIANKKSMFIELSDQLIDTRPRQCQSADNVTIEVNASIHWKITDPYKAVYHVDSFEKSLIDIALNSMRSEVGKLKLDQILSNRQKLNQAIASDLSVVSDTWGIHFLRVEIQDINYSQETADVMLQEMTAERKKRALIAEAEGESESLMKKANANANATIIESEAKGRALEISTKAEGVYLDTLIEKLGIENATKILAADKYIQAMEQITKNPSHKVFLPNNSQSILEISDK